MVWVALVALAVYFLFLVRGVLLPFILALIISVLLEPSVKKLRMRGYPRWLAIGLVFLVFFTLLGGLGFWLAPVVSGQLYNSRVAIERLTSQLGVSDPNDNFFIRWNPVVRARPADVSPIDRVFKDWSPVLERIGLPTTRKQFVDTFVTPNQKEINAQIQSFFKGAFGLIPTIGIQLMYLLITPLLVAFMLVDMDRLKRRGAMWIPPQIRAETLQLLKDIGQVFENYLRGVTVAILMYMAGGAILLSLLGAPYSVLLGLLFGALYLIPFIGALSSWIILFSVTGFSGKDHILGIGIASPWMAAMIVTLAFVLYDRLFDMMVYPRIVGKAVGLNPIVSMFVVFSGGALFGIAGMLLAFPLAGAVKVILDRVIRVTSQPSEVLDLPAVPLRHRAAG